MKSTGIVRKVDELGRVVLPIELRRSLDIQVKDPLEIFVDEERVILQKYKASKTCFITGEISDENIELPGGQYISQKGKEILKKYL
ncbi:AbrB/MazE/SpoVT family DNA-binding domain-containing protein [Virgibacillus sp. AGTR]|uniref:AbrB/MazE/SpoVT family DNA-binding domain-containing protein n=1 Tax=Virgibacillus sp. AGTR TaxID=2812055 RepID=UPI001D16C336|nr:AbrB/MazE/SpoVT family DNA-binding domain-containing protein [Virgibacillus sp. AGTR]MCC2248895.1 AbrB/MazE/SpoVT family DNA-binding domain-containing protein [Virgibacillus sp. AGTR]